MSVVEAVAAAALKLQLPFDDSNMNNSINGTYEISVFFEFVVPGVLLNSVGLMGLLGNLLSIIVLSRPQMKSSINCILIGETKGHSAHKFGLKT